LRFFRISRVKYDTPATAFSGEGASKVAHRWNSPGSAIRAVYCSDTLALACLECLVHIRPLPRAFPGSLFFEVDIPDALLERPPIEALPPDWDSSVPGNAARHFGMEFLLTRRAAGLVLPTAIQPLGFNVLLNPLHPSFDLNWVKGPFDYRFDSRLR